jgi:hypothetical protein
MAHLEALASSLDGAIWKEVCKGQLIIMPVRRSKINTTLWEGEYILTHLLRYKEVGLEDKKQLGFSSFLFIVSFHKKKSMFSELNSDINSFKSSLLHLTGQP